MHDDTPPGPLDLPNARLRSFLGKTPLTRRAGFSGMAFLPSTVARIGLTPGGLSVGVQIIGPEYGDRTCIEFARLLEREYYAFVPPPGYE